MNGRNRLHQINFQFQKASPRSGASYIYLIGFLPQRVIAIDHQHHEITPLLPHLGSRVMGGSHRAAVHNFDYFKRRAGFHADTCR